MVEGGLYHVYNRFARGEDVFSDPEEAVDFIERLRQAKERDGFVVFAWCLMSNHFHLALRMSAVPLSRTMHGVQNGFSREFNQRRRRTGPLWQSRYKAKLIDAEEYLAQVIVYVHLNPVRAGLAGGPGEYTMSGHRELMGKVRSPLCDVDEALLSFGETVRSARRTYVGNLKIAMKDEGVGEKVGRLPWWSRDRELEVDGERPDVDAVGRTTGLERPKVAAERFITLACELLGADAAVLGSRRQDRDTARTRRLIAACGIERWGQGAGKLAAVLHKHPVVVSRWVREAWDLKKEDEDFASDLDTLDRSLSTTAKQRLFELRAHDE
jgi:REP element-mobilizing transposase RayT